MDVEGEDKGKEYKGRSCDNEGDVKRRTRGEKDERMISWVEKKTRKNVNGEKRERRKRGKRNRG